MSNPVSGKNKKNITNLSSAELAQRVVRVNWTNLETSPNCFTPSENGSTLNRKNLIPLGHCKLRSACAFMVWSGPSLSASVDIAETVDVQGDLSLYISHTLEDTFHLTHYRLNKLPHTIYWKSPPTPSSPVASTAGPYTTLQPSLKMPIFCDK